MENLLQNIASGLWIVLGVLSVAHPKAGAMCRRADNG